MLMGYISALVDGLVLDIGLIISAYIVHMLPKSLGSIHMHVLTINSSTIHMSTMSISPAKMARGFNPLM